MKTIALFLIKTYQYALSPWLGRQCRFQPTCSHYAKEAIETYGIYRGAKLSFLRICRCHPWHRGGYDPLP